MAKKNLSEDEIKYIVSAETSKAQKELHELSTVTKELKREERERRKAMVELEAQGKKNTDEYRNLSKECKEYTKRISENEEKQEELIRKLDVNAMSMVQLRKQSKELRRELDNTSKAMDPGRYAVLETQLKKVDERMNELKVSAKSLREIATSETALGTLTGMLTSKLSDVVAEKLQQMKDVADEGIKMAEASDGVKRAFDRLDDGAILNNLRKNTKGTVTDLELMKATVQANDFRIPLQDLGKYLQFAQLKAQQTGQSVDYMTSSIITGLGRKSVMILDNLGLSASEINEQMAQTGDFMSAVASIVDKQLAAAGDNYVSAADRAQAATVRFQNAQLKLGEALLPYKEEWEELTTDMEVSTMEVIGWLLKHKNALITLTVAVTTYVAVQKLQQLQTEKNILASAKEMALEKGKAALLTIGKGITLLYAAAKATLTGNTVRATAAMKLFNSVTSASPLGLLIAALATGAAAFLLFRDRTSGTEKSINDLNHRLASEKAELDNVFNAMKKTNPGTSERISLVRQLQEQYPGLLSNYDLERASLKEITRAQNEANTALTNRIATEMRAKTTSDFVQKNISTQMEKVDYLLGEAEREMGTMAFSKFQNSMKKVLNDSKSSFADFWKTFGSYFNFKLGSDAIASFQDTFLSLRIDQKNLASGLVDINNKYAPYLKSIKTSVTLTDEELKQQMESTSIIKKLEKEKERVQNTWKEDTKKNLTLKNTELERLDAEINKYKELGTIKSANDKKKRDNAVNALAEKEQKARVSTEQEAVKSLEALREEDLQNQQKYYNTYAYAFNSDLSQDLITKEEHEMLMLELEKTNAEARLKIEQSYFDDAQSMVFTDASTKEDIIRKSGQRVVDAEKSANAARLSEQEKFNALVKDFKEQFKLANVDEDYKAQVKVLEAKYQALKSMGEKDKQDSSELDAAYNRASEQLEYEHQEKIQSIRNQYGLSTQQEQFNAELLRLQNALDQQLMTQEEHEKAVQNLKRDSYKKQFDYYSKLFSGAVDALQQAEMDNIDAKYDAEIAAAKGNTEEVERLENEKEQKKLEVQKKYADVNFAIKASQIIADTAVSIMKAYAELGPVAGMVAAAMLGITGAAQLMSANAERQKIKNMTVSGSSSSSSGTRTATGRQSGGKVDVRRAQDGKFFPDADFDPDKRGYVDHPTVIVGEGPSGQSKEWVASNAALENPTIAPFIDILDRSQQAGTIRTLDLNNAIRAHLTGYSSGGSISTKKTDPGTTPANLSGVSIPPELMIRLAQSIIRIDEEGVSAPVVLSDIERKQALRDRARKIGSKK